ncbi:guanine nucleotide binding protein, partial [Ochromonadaceae sp. CCMP2298]
MGCEGSKMTAEEKDRKKKHQEFESDLANQAKQEDEKIKLLLLGAGESGKSTIF